MCETDNTIIPFPSLYFYLHENVIYMCLWPHCFPDGIVNFQTIILWIFVCYIIIIIKSEIWITSHRVRLGHKTVTCVVCLAMLWTHWGRDNMATISQTTFSNEFSWMKMLEFWFKFNWRLFLRVQLTIFHHWFRLWLGAEHATSHCLNQWWLDYWRIYASLGLNELIICNALRLISHQADPKDMCDW